MMLRSYSPTGEGLHLDATPNEIPECLACILMWYLLL